jgi:hypothetical protein
MLEVTMNLTVVTSLSSFEAIGHDFWPIVSSQPDSMIHLGTTLMATAHSMVHLL